MVIGNAAIAPLQIVTFQKIYVLLENCIPKKTVVIKIHHFGKIEIFSTHNFHSRIGAATAMS